MQQQQNDKKRKRQNAAQDGNAQENARKEMYEAVRERNVVKLNKLVATWTSTESGEVPGEIIDGCAKENPLLLAVEEDYIDGIKVLLKAGAYAGIKRDDGHTALMVAVLHQNEEAVRLLAELGDLDQRKGWMPDHPEDVPTVLHIAAEYGFTKACDILIEAGADLEAIYLADTALVIAAKEGEFECLELLIKKGANTEVCDPFGYTALIKAAKAGEEECARALIEGGASVDTADNAGFTALIHCVREGEDEIAKCLIEAGADVNCKDRRGKSALAHAIEKGDDDLVDMLEQAGAR